MQQTPDLIISNNVFGRRPGELSAIRIASGRITSVDSLAEVDVSAVLAGSRSSMDLRGSMLLPGLIDSHVHAIATGMFMLSENLQEVTNLAQLEAAIRRIAARGERVVRLGGLDLSRLDKAEHPLLDRAWLDGIVNERPLIIKSVEGHSSWFNSRGWEMVIDERIMAEEGLSREAIDEMYRRGRLHGGAYEKHTTPLYDSYSHEERAAGMRLVLDTARRMGLTGIHCLEGYGDFRREDFQLILGLDGQGCDLTLYCRDSTPKLAHELGVPRFGGCWCVDGAIGSHSAAVSEPYADRAGHCGELYFDDAELAAWIRSGIEHDMQVCVHAIGDRALEQTIRIYEELAPQHDLARSRHRVDHFILGDEGQAERAARLGLCSSMQPAFDARWGGESGGYATRLGSKRALETNPVGTMHSCGLKVGGSSDSYITPLDPLGGMHAAMNHHNPRHRVDFDTAVAMFTSVGAWLGHADEDRGSIAAGQSANFTVVNGNRSLEAASVRATVHRGTVTFDSELETA
ncbi:MAG: amidohydrolase family protein [Planctomycetales bacterium]|nr:amidohydrolase family protein [bacterium]UNM08352.1 MAG: amidohydrolase family protein [Planctomycetales bacterium]